MSHEDQLSNIETALQFLLNGEFDKIPEGSCQHTRLIKQIANLNGERVRRNLKRTVDMSITANKGVSGVAEMLQEIGEVSNQSQSIAAAVEELATSVESISQSASGATNEVVRVAQSASNGLDAAKKAQITMDNIADSVQQSAGKVDDLSTASEEIGKIVKDIEAIAKQTNLLALNATIEAARAGDAGKGFAVVASEVKSLSSQTANATENIRNRIDKLRHEMDGIITAMNDANNKAAEGRDVINASTREMTGIFEQVNVVNERMQEINGILGEQAIASQEVSAGVVTIAQMSSKNLKKVNDVIDILEATEAPIIESLNDLFLRGGESATIYVAKSDHMIWMRKLSQMLAGRTSLNPDELADHHSCRLGKWYDTQSNPHFTSLPEWRALKKPHCDVHESGIEAARLFAKGDIKGAIKAVHEAAAASEKVMTILDQLGDKL